MGAQERVQRYDGGCSKKAKRNREKWKEITREKRQTVEQNGLRGIKAVLVWCRRGREVSWLLPKIQCRIRSIIIYKSLVLRSCTCKCTKDVPS